MKPKVYKEIIDLGDGREVSIETWSGANNSSRLFQLRIIPKILV